MQLPNGCEDKGTRLRELKRKIVAIITHKDLAATDETPLHDNTATPFVRQVASTKVQWCSHIQHGRSRRRATQEKEPWTKTLRGLRRDDTPVLGKP